MTPARRLHVVARPQKPPPVAADLERDGSMGDLVLTATLFAVFAAPLVGTLAHLGAWGPGTVGLGAAGSILAGRELWTAAAAAVRARRRS